MANNPVKKENPNHVPFWEAFSYGCGDIGTNLYLNSIAIFLLLFYTDYLGIPAVIAGSIMLISRIWDGINDVIIGAIADRVGNYKRWIFWGALLSCFTFLLMFLIPPFGITGKIIYAFLTFSIWTVTYTCLGVPINAMASTITPDATARAHLNNIRFPMITVPLFVSTAFTMPLVNWLGVVTGKPSWAFPIVAFSYGFIGWLLVLVCCKNVKERAPIVRDTTKKFHFKETLSAFKGNKFALIFMSMFFFHFLAHYTASAVFAYFCKYYLNNMWILSVYAFFTVPASFVGMSIGPKIFLKIGKRKMAMISTMGIAVTFFIRFLIPTNLTLIVACGMIQSFFSGIITVMCYTMAGDVVTYTKWKKGGENVAIFYSSGIFSQKTAMAFSAFFGGAFLTFFGYVANAQQSATAMQGILIVYTIVPLISEIILFFIVRGWTLDNHESLGYIQKG